MINFPMKAQPVRNNEIFRLREDKGWSYRKIGDFFNISHERVRQIYTRELKKYNARNGILENGENANAQEFYKACFVATDELNIDERYATRVYNSLKRAGIIDILSKENNLDSFSDEKLLSLWSFGPRCLQVARLANDIFIQ